MAYINTQTNQYPVSEADIRTANPNTSFAIPFQAPVEYAPVLESPTPEYNPMTQGVREVAPTKDELGNWMRTYEVYDLDPEQVTANEEAAKQRNKKQAELSLQQTDWVEVPSVSDVNRIPHLANYEEFMTYRMALRAIAVTPSVVVTEWPVLPQENWITV